MQINKVMGVSNSPRVCSHSTKSVQSKNIAFKGFESIMRSAYAIDMTKTSSVTKNFREIYKVLLKERGIKIMPAMKTLEQYCNFAEDNIEWLLKELTKPVAKVKSNLRDIVYESRERNIPLIKDKYSINALYIENCGKYGFFNRLFDSESAGNDIRFTLKANDYKYQVGVDKDGWLKLRKEWGDNWDESEYWVFNRRSHKSGAYIPGHIAFTP